MKKILTTLICCFCISIASAQSELEGFQSEPKLLLEEVFRAANEQDYSNLFKLCPPNKANDGDIQKYICDIASSSEQGIKEFISYFKNARITGEVTYSSTSDGTVSAQIPFWFNHPVGESRSNETMNLVKVDGKWYLSSF
jgi:diacylglycerol kinase family enzyme